MANQVNLQDFVRKTVGRRRVPRSIESIGNDTKANARAWSKAIIKPFVPKGIYRFKTHEEADQWLWKMITRPRKS